MHRKPKTSPRATGPRGAHSGGTGRCAGLAPWVAAGLTALAAPAFADDADSPHHDFFFDTMQDALGREIVYPEGPARVMAAYGHLAPGESTEWHVHEFPIYIQILEGELTVDYGDGLVTTFGPGDSLVEVVDFVHKGSNLGDVPVKTIAVYIGAEGLEASVDVD